MISNQPEYDSIASKYAGMRENCALNVVEYYTVYECMLRPLLDDRGLLTGKRVFDLGCGDGRHTRRLKALDCAYILGVDISSALIEIAREVERHDLKHIEYLVTDAKQLPSPEQPFDLVTAFYLLPHARTREELLDMARTIYAQLGENKQFIGMTSNYNQAQSHLISENMELRHIPKRPSARAPYLTARNLSLLSITSKMSQCSTVTDYHYSPVTYEEVFKEAGFKSFQRVPYQYYPDAPEKTFFDDLINSQSSIGIIATE